MSFSQRVQEIRGGFERAFWVANITELFERLAYYGASAILAIYLSEQLHFSKELTGWSRCWAERWPTALAFVAP